MFEPSEKFIGVDDDAEIVGNIIKNAIFQFFFFGAIAIGLYAAGFRETVRFYTEHNFYDCLMAFATLWGIAVFFNIRGDFIEWCAGIAIPAGLWIFAYGLGEYSFPHAILFIGCYSLLLAGFVARWSGALVRACTVVGILGIAIGYPMSRGVVPKNPELIYTPKESAFMTAEDMIAYKEELKQAEIDRQEANRIEQIEVAKLVEGGRKHAEKQRMYKDPANCIDGLGYVGPGYFDEHLSDKSGIRAIISSRGKKRFYNFYFANYKDGELDLNLMLERLEFASGGENARHEFKLQYLGTNGISVIKTRQYVIETAWGKVLKFYEVN